MQVRFRMLLYFFWVMGGVVHCGHLLILLCVGPRLHMETGRFLHRRILQVNFAQTVLVLVLVLALVLLSCSPFFVFRSERMAACTHSLSNRH